MFWKAADAVRTNVAFVRPGFVEIHGSAVGVFEWRAPYDDPRDHADTTYLFNGHTLGKGDAGFSALLRELPVSGCKAIIEVASEYRDDTSFSGLEEPYFRIRDQLRAVLAKYDIHEERAWPAPRLTWQRKAYARTLGPRP
jgi:hypothetical protein